MAPYHGSLLATSPQSWFAFTRFLLDRLDSRCLMIGDVDIEWAAFISDAKMLKMHWLAANRRPCQSQRLALPYFSGGSFSGNASTSRVLIHRARYGRQTLHIPEAFERRNTLAAGTLTRSWADSPELRDAVMNVCDHIPRSQENSTPF